MLKKTMKKRTRLWLWLAVSFLTFTVIVPQLVLSLWGADLAGRVLTGALEKRVTIQQVAGGWWWGLQIDGVRISDDLQDGAKTLLELGRLHLGTPIWMLFLPGGALDVVVDELRVELRRLPDGAWNVAALQRASVRSAPQRIDLPEKSVRFELTHGRVYLESEDLAYALAAEAQTPSLASQPLEWSLELSASDGSSLSASGALAKLETPEEITGNASFEINRLDLGIVPPLVPDLPVMYPDGSIEQGHVRVDLQGFSQLRVRADLDLRDISLPDIGRESEAQLSRGSIRVALERDGARWTFETLALEGPDGGLSLAPGGWFELGETWRGNLDFRGDLGDTEPASRALAMLFPDPLTLTGALHVNASVEGALSLDADTAWPARLADLKAEFALSLAQARWQRERLRDIVVRAAVDNGRLTVPKVTASIGKGEASLQGELAIGDSPGGSLTWTVSGVSLATLLGPEVRTFDVTKASGSLSFEGGAYRLRSEALVRALAFDRKALDERELRLDNANLECAGTLPQTLSRLDVTRCLLKAAQAEVLSEQGRLELGGNDPALELELTGWLSGPFMKDLIPEIAARWPAKVQLRGPLTVPLTGETWMRSSWRFDATGKDFGYANLAFTALEARVTKSADRLNFSVSGRRGAGKISADGALDLGAEAKATIEIKADRVPFETEVRSGYRLAAVVFGSGRVAIDARGESFTLKNRLEDVTFRRGRDVISRLRSGTLEGQLERTRRGSLWAKQLRLAGDQLSLRLRESHLPLEGRSKEPLRLNLEFSGDGAWIELAATMLAGVEQLAAKGPSELSLSLRGQPGRLPASMQGSGQLRVAQLSLWGWPLSNAAIAFDLEPNGVNIHRGEMRYNGGELTLGGNVVLPILEAARRQHLTLRLNQVPMRYARALSEFEGAPARLVTETAIDGQIVFERNPGGPLAVDARLQTEAVRRRIERPKERVSAIELPPLEGSLRLTAADSLERWKVASFSVRGRGAVVELAEGTLTLKDSLYELAAPATLELSPEFVEGLTLGLPQARFDPNGSLKASGRAILRMPTTRPWALTDVDFAGNVGLEELKLDADTLSTLRLTLQLTDGRLDVRNGEASLLGGRVWLPSPSAVNLQGPAHAFNVHVAAENLKLQTYAGRKVSLGDFLALLVPVFVFTPASGAEGVRLSGVLRFDLGLAGTYEKDADWTRSVNGNGSFRIENATVAGSTLVTGILAKSLLMPTNVVNNTIAALFSRDGRIGRELADLSDDAFRFRTIESPITVTNGEISLAKNLKLTSPELELTLNGHSNLNGEVDYKVDTDLIKRIRLGKITDLPNRIPVIGRALSFINPFTYLDGIELQAKITGNVLQRGPEGGANVQVHTSVLNTKAPSP